MSSAKKVAVNTFAMYTQLIVNVLIGLISVRIILNALGASDYGIYNLIAGIITMLGFIKNSLSQTSIRFISVSLGENDKRKINKAFSSCFYLHAIIAISLAIIMEIVGLFLFDGFLNIPEDRIHAAKVIYHCMTFSLFINVFGTPFRALLVAHEKFVYISFVGIFDAILKLLIALVIVRVQSDKLQVYGFLMAIITVINIFCYYIVCQIKYRNDMSFVRCNKKDLGQVSGFAGWTLMDVAGSVATRQGYAILLNIYFGTIVNAVFALARQLEGHIYQISSSVIDSMKPQIMKSKGAGDDERMLRLSLTAGKFGLMLMSLIAIPLMVNMDYVLKLWLKEVPEGTAIFSIFLILACMAEQLTKGLVFANQAIGNIKWFSISVSSMRFIALPISWLLFSLGAPAIAAIITFTICESLGSLSRVFILSRLSDFQTKTFFRSLFTQILPPALIATLCCMGFSRLVNGIWGLLLSLIITDCLYLLVMYLFGLSLDEKKSIKSIIGTFTKKKKNI